MEVGEAAGAGGADGGPKEAESGSGQAGASEEESKKEEGVVWPVIGENIFPRRMVLIRIRAWPLAMPSTAAADAHSGAAASVMVHAQRLKP